MRSRAIKAIAIAAAVLAVAAVILALGWAAVYTPVSP